MKLTIATLIAAATTAVSASAGAVTAGGMNPDSVWVRPSYQEGTMHCQLDYSVDSKHWTHVDLNIFDSDYGPWGSEKKLYNVVLRYDGKKYRAEFTPSPKDNPQVAITESDNLYLWKPQSYPVLEKAAFDAKLAELKAEASGNMIRIPYSDLKMVLLKAAAAKGNVAMEQENFVKTGKEATRKRDIVKSELNVHIKNTKAISPMLYGIFFEDISYAADGGLYAEMVRNRDFEFTANDHRGWNAQTAWSLKGEGTTLSIESADPLHANNPHHAVLKTTETGATLVNEGFDGIPVKANAKYDLSLFVKGKGKVAVRIVDGDKVIAEKTFSATSGWKQQKAVLVAKADADSAQLEIAPLQAGELQLDMVSLFPQDTYKGRKNGLRKDLAEALEGLMPKFVRFPGGCATHGQGIDNIYHWQATVGELWERQPDMNIWNYHQTRGLGFYEYFQMCEDMGAEPLPVLAAGVPCQNSWKGGNGQQGGIPFERDLKGKPSPYTYMGKPLTMESYLQELLDLIEWANGDPKTSKLAQMRAKAGHPKSFNMKYLGIGNEDLISDEFLERYLFLINGVKKAHPEITIVGTVGPFWEGSDYEFGWKYARDNKIEIVDEHYYNPAPWFVNHQDFYDSYDRNGTKVYLGEWASKGNFVTNALAEALYLTNVERNADVVVMSSYAPLFAKERHTNWNPDMIYFNNKEVKPTVNYDVHSSFAQNAGDQYVYSTLTSDVRPEGRKLIGSSVVTDSQTGDIIIKLVNVLPISNSVTVKLGEEFKSESYVSEAQVVTCYCTSEPDVAKSWSGTETSSATLSGNELNVELKSNSFAIVRIYKKRF